MHCLRSWLETLPTCSWPTTYFRHINASHLRTNCHLHSCSKATLQLHFEKLQSCPVSSWTSDQKSKLINIIVWHPDLQCFNFKVDYSWYIKKAKTSSGKSERFCFCPINLISLNAYMYCLSSLTLISLSSIVSHLIPSSLFPHIPFTAQTVWTCSSEPRARIVHREKKSLCCFRVSLSAPTLMLHVCRRLCEIA